MRPGSAGDLCQQIALYRQAAYRAVERIRGVEFAAIRMEHQMRRPVPYAKATQYAAVLEIYADDVAVAGAGHEHAPAVRREQGIVGAGANRYRLNVVVVCTRPHDGQRAGAAPCDANDTVVGYRG